MIVRRDEVAPIVCVVGRGKTGKTTLLEKLIPELKSRGYKVGTIKRHSHPGLDFDVPGKDSWRHAQAGSDYVVVAGPDKMASMRNLERELTLDEVAATVTGVDIILVEGYKRADKPKIEVVRAERSSEPLCTADELLALVTDVDIAMPVPRFGLNDVRPLADLIVARCLPADSGSAARSGHG
jgi:molybdopterin-guanine dinucleotide biosynthesis adapter protein